MRRVPRATLRDSAWSGTSTQTRDDDFVRIDRGKVFQNMAPVVLRNRHAKPAVLQLRVEISAIEEQV